MDEEFLELISLTERLHRRYLQFVKVELVRLGVREANPTQALLLLKLGHTATSMTGLTLSGFYQGTNPSYNVKRLVQGGFVRRERRARDQRSNYLRLTEKGHQLRRQLLSHYHLQAEQLKNELLSAQTIDSTTATLRGLEQWLSSVTEGAPLPRRLRRLPAPRAVGRSRRGGRPAARSTHDPSGRTRSALAALAKPA